MNDGHDGLYAVRTYSDPKSQAARDRWLAFRESQNMPVVQHFERFADIPGAFQKQFSAMRERQTR